MPKALAGAAAVILVCLGAKYLSSHSHSPDPTEPPPMPVDPTPTVVGADGGVN